MYQDHTPNCNPPNTDSIPNFTGEYERKRSIRELALAYLGDTTRPARECDVELVWPKTRSTRGVVGTALLGVLPCFFFPALLFLAKKRTSPGEATREIRPVTWFFRCGKCEVQRCSERNAQEEVVWSHLWEAGLTALKGAAKTKTRCIFKTTGLEESISCRDGQTVRVGLP